MSTALSRTALAETALGLIQSGGLDALTMRTLADRAGVRAASIYWHVRDREELLELVADALLARIPVSPADGDWRRAVHGLCLAAGRQVDAQRDGARILLGAPAALRRSAVYARLVAIVVGAGLPQDLSHEVAAMVLSHVVTRPSGRFALATPGDSPVRTLAVDSGSRGVVVRSGGLMDTPFRVPHDRSAAPGTVVRGDRVIVRRLRGGKRGEIEVNPSLPWRVQVQGGTWNTLLDLAGVTLRELHLDSGAAKVECLLPRPRGVVGIQVSGGVIGTVLRRVAGTAVVAHISSGTVQVSLDGFHPRPSMGDAHWETPGAASAADRYELRISGGAVRVHLDASAPGQDTTVAVATVNSDEAAMTAALDVVLDGVAAHLRR